MNNNDKIKKGIIESVAIIGIMSLYIVYGIHYMLPLVLILPVPFIILGIRNGLYSNIVSLVLTSLIVGLLLGITSGISLILLFAPLSLAINYSIKTRRTTTEAILISTAAFFLSFIIFMSFEGKISNIDIIRESEQVFAQLITMQIEIFKETGMTNHEILQATNLLENTYNNTIVLIPSILAIFALFVGYINLVLSSKVLRKMGYGTMSPQRFSRFRLPDNIIVGTGVMFLATLMIRKLEIQYHEALLLNLIFLVGFIFIVQGFSVLDYLLIKSKVKLIPRIILLTMNIIVIPASGIMFIVGVLDSIFDIKKIRRRKSL